MSIEFVDDLEIQRRRKEDISREVQRLHGEINRIDPNSRDNADAQRVLAILVRSLREKDRTKPGTSWRSIAEGDVQVALAFAMEYLTVARVPYE